MGPLRKNQQEGGCVMFNPTSVLVGKGWQGRATLLGVAISFLVLGLLAGPSFHWPGNSEAGAVGIVSRAGATDPMVPGTFADLARRLEPTVVNIRVTKIEKTGFSQGFPFPEGPQGEFFRKFFGEMPQHPENFKTRGAGSGVIIDRDGHILTNNHVVEGAQEVVITMADKQEYKAKIVGRDPKTDLAVLKIDAREPLAAATLGNSDQLRVGDWVMAIGNPFGLSNTVTSGIVSAKGRVIGAGPYDDFIQTDASINPGNSGGPLFNLKGEVVGINTAIVPQGQGIGFAIPVNVAKPLIPQLVSKGEVTRGYLGVSIQALNAELGKALKVEKKKGVLVGDVMPDSPAAKAGIHEGDVIVSFNKKSVAEPRELSSLVANTAVGSEVPVAILRDGKEKMVTVKIDRLESPKNPASETSHPGEGKWGLGLKELNPGNQKGSKGKGPQGVVVASVQSGSPADAAGVHEGDIILSVNRHRVNSVQEALEAISQTPDRDTLLLQVKRPQGSFFVALNK
jgi:serine protease Do